jgi:Amt family ammonium transporter
MKLIALAAAALLAGCATAPGGANYAPMVDTGHRIGDYNADLAECQSYAQRVAGAGEGAAAGAVGGAIVIGLAAGILCLWGVNGLKKLLGADDSLDVFGVHGVGGILGALLTGVFAAPSLGGTGVYDYVTNKVGDFDMTAQVISQLWGVGTVIVWSGVVSLIAYKLVDMVIGLRVPEEEEREGLDITSHGESAYHY